MLLNTGTPRSVAGNAVSSAVAGLIVAGFANYQKYQNGEISKQTAVTNSVKLAAQSAVAGACAIGFANALGKQNSTLNALLESGAFLLVGVAGVCAIEAIDFETQKLLN